MMMTSMIDDHDAAGGFCGTWAHQQAWDKQQQQQSRQVIVEGGETQQQVAMYVDGAVAAWRIGLLTFRLLCAAMTGCAVCTDCWRLCCG
jgi:hypothetical protein